MKTSATPSGPRDPLCARAWPITACPAPSPWPSGSDAPDDSVTAARNKIAVDIDVQVIEGPLTAPLLKYRENLKPGDINHATGEVLTEPRSFTVIVPNLPPGRGLPRRRLQYLGA